MSKGLATDGTATVGTAAVGTAAVGTAAVGTATVGTTAGPGATERSGATQPVAPVIDAHQHLWHYNEVEYDWMSGEQEVLKRDHLPDELERLMAGAGVTGTVAVQARRTVAETEWLLSVAARHSFILGVVGWVDFTSPRLEADLERLATDAALVGVRELIHDMPDLGYATSNVHVAGVRAAARHGLAYDLLLKPQHLPAATALVDLLPEQRFVVDHCAKPDVAAGGVQPWAHDLAELARRDNVWCKLSGLVTEADWEGQADVDFVPYADVVLEAFGPDRVMVGSDWPVCTCARDYRGTMDLARLLVSRLSAEEQARVLAGTCLEFYGLRPPA